MEKGTLKSLLPLVVFLGLLAVWLWGLPRSLTWSHNAADGGDWAAAALRSSLPHPPGAPLYHLLTRLLVRLPLEPARALSGVSAFMAALSAALLAAAFLPQSPALALGAGLLLAAAPAFASQAVIVEVYTTAACFMAWLVYLTRRAAPAWLVGLVWGLGLGVHLTLAAAGFWLMMTMDSRRARGVLLGVAGLVAGLQYAWLVPFLGRGAPSPWVDLRSLQGWWAYVSAELYHGYVFSLPWNAWPQRLLAGLAWWVRQVTPLGALVMVHAWRYPLTRTEKGAWISLGLISLYAWGYNVPDAWTHLVAYLPLAVGLVATGWSSIGTPWRRWERELWLLIPALAWILSVPPLLLRGADEAARWAEDTLQSAPPAAVLCPCADGTTFALWYAQARGLRPDVLVVDVDLLAYGPYQSYLSRQGFSASALRRCQPVSLPPPSGE